MDKGKVWAGIISAFGGTIFAVIPTLAIFLLPDTPTGIGILYVLAAGGFIGSVIAFEES